MTPGDICLASFLFGGSAGMKLRPVLVLTPPVGPVPEVLVAYISSVIPPVSLPTDILVEPTLPEHASTHLKATSVVRLHKLATIHGRSVIRRLGRIGPGTAADVAAKLRALLNL
jgi:mRNA interferase MazF